MYYSRIEKDEPNPLEKRLLDSSHGSTDSVAGMSKEEIKAVGEMTSQVEAKSQQSKYNQYLAGRIYASNAPKIFLETISARTAALIIALTYIFFILGFCVDFYTTYQSFHSTNFQLPALACTNAPAAALDSTLNYYSCSDGKSWNGTVTDLSNVISVKLNVFQNNITSILSNATSEFDVTYDIKLWACYNDGGCGDKFAPNTYYTNDFDVWQHVYTEDSRTLHVDVSQSTKKVGAVTNIEASLIPSLFQNQESIPTNGLVKSYFISLEYIDDPYGIFVNPTDPYHPVYYNFDVVERPRQLGVNVVTILLLFVTLAVLASYVVMLSHQKKILSEQKWVVAYFVLLVMFQNPIYCVIVFYEEAPHANTAYASYVLGCLAQAGLFMLWLLFADSVHRKTSSKLYFYLPKLLIGLTILTFSLLILTFQFPGLSAQAQANEHARSAVEAVANWSPSLKNKFISFTIIYLVLIWLWTVYWFVRLYFTGRKLKKLPYMSTRYIQLSYRFFSLQATLVTLYYFFQYVIVIVFITQGVTTTYDTTTLTDNINILFRQQTQLFGKTLFLTVYALILSFLFLPSNLRDDKSALMASLSATYVITETEHRILVKTRKIMMNSMKRNIINQIALVNQLTGTKVDVFCIETALNLRNIAFQAYYDPVGLSTASGYDGHMNLGSIGFELVDLTYVPEQEVFCFISREKSTGRLIVAFRGTASKKQMEANLKYTQRAIVFSSLTTATLDYLDGLTIKHAEEDDKYELDSVSDDDEEGDLGLESTHNGSSHHTKDDHDHDRGSTIFGGGGYSGKSGRSHSRDSEDGVPGAERTGVVSDGLKRVFSGANAVTHAVVDGAGAVVEGAAGAIASAVAKTPGLKNVVKVYVHSGFWEAYEHVREFIHAILRKELVKTPTTVFFTGHSLGGALATFAALDVTLHTIPRVNAWLKHQEKIKQRRPADIEQADPSRQSLFSSFSRTLTGALGPVSTFASSTFMPRATTYQNDGNGTGNHGSGAGASPVKPPPFVKKIKVFMYNFGSPKVGNGNFVNFYDKMVPSSYRVVVDGDIVPALPPQSKYSHVGTEILIDSVGAGSIIIDPSFVERWLRTHMKSSVAVHSLLVYRKGLLGIKLSAEFMRANANAKDNVDPLRLALKVRAHHDVKNILDENAGIEVDMVSSSNLPALDEDEEARELSVSDVISAALPCKPRTEGDIELGDEPIDIELMDSTVVSETSNPVLAEKHSKLESLRAGVESKDGHGEDLSERDIAATHYAQDVAQMELLRLQLADMHTPAAVKWMKAKASKLNRATSPMRGASSRSPTQASSPTRGVLERSTSDSSAQSNASQKSGKKGGQVDDK